MRSQMLRFACAVVAALGITVGTASSEDYPTRSVKLINPFAAGGTGDLVARVVAKGLAGPLGKPVIVEDKIGANGIVGATDVAHADPDGYTFLQMSPGNLIIASTKSDMPYDWQRDLLPLIGIGGTPLALVVNAKSGIHSIDDLIKAAKATSGGIFYASGGTGSMSHLAPAHFATEMKFPATHVPYRGLRPAVEALIANQVQFAFLGMGDVEPFIKSGDLVALGVTADSRLHDLPNVPTMRELGLQDFEPQIWYGYVVPAKTPDSIISRLRDALLTAVHDPDVQAQLDQLAVTVKPTSPDDFQKFMQDEAVRWRRVIEANHIQLD
jgi:tripartite-type tricarboxylate transporter receptor subunit TctC